ncbi:hypothetical protein N7516_007341 [Penicillium verrucosum]|uniref:uncharacterized protein n=1 Tax=Penicillium verrucosum TaxID=60171 RepID=UPI0025455EBF|nr:uncharacterized protein N7516_007341 [Penicillium verrucosum]KAJ5932852.1 hypothetical protein N7516_007341 [Penicillium verrucosum]
MSDPAAYTIGWICALPVEYIAAQEFLDEEHDKPSFVSPNDANDYTLGRMSEHNVVIAVLPDSEYGTASAASVATNMLNSFHNIRIGLMVGIGGSVPSDSHNIRLGDVVVSTPRGGESGVFQYDFGKSIQDQSFQHTRFLNQPPAILRATMSGIRTQYERKGHQLKEAINGIFRKNIRLRRKYKRPEPITDRLFLPEAIHNQASYAICAVDPSTLVLRSERADDEDNPTIHYSLIASGNQLMKDALIRDRLTAEKDVLCFEMEAAGLMNTFPCLVIRGIYDYSDSHKNKDWQGYAAMVAATYAKDLLQRISLNRIEAEERIGAVVSDELKGIRHRLDQAYSQHERHFSEQKARVLTDQQRSCYQVFKIINYAEQKNINPKRAKGTCRWALRSSEYIRCGKSVLARSIIDDYSETSHPTNNLATALCSVLHQLFSQQPHLLQYTIPAWEKNGGTLRQEVDELWRILIAATSANISCKTICILDTLDECRETDQRRLIKKLQAFHRQPSSLTEETCLKFLVTSRPYDHIQDHFRAVTDSFPHIHIKGEEQNDQIHEEIDLVVRIRVRELARTVPLSPELHHRIEQQLLQMEHPIDDIRTTFKDSLRPTEDWITLIPPSVNKAYEKILCRVPAGLMNRVKKILEIIVAARRPLTIREMAMALGIATSSGSPTTKQAGLAPIGLDGKLRRWCGLFVFTNNSKIYLIHQTAREFLIKKKISSNPTSAYWNSVTDAEDQMAKICLRYLLMEDSEYDEDESGSLTGSFLEYSATHWPDHVRNMALTSIQKETDRVHRLYDISGKPFSLWFPIFWKVAGPYREIPVMSALHLAAFNGHEQEVRSILSVDKRDVNTPDDTKTYPLIWASLNGHDETVELLLERGADVNAQGGLYENALYAACFKGHDKIAQMLLERGADVNAQGGFYENALYAACFKGHDKIAQMLLERGADVNAQGGEYGNALQAACAGGHDKITQMLLERGADVNAQGGLYENALYAACFKGHDKIAQILLERGADVNTQGGFYENALYTACFKGHDKIAQMLLERGADVYAQGGEYGNALQAACAGGHDKITQMLLERGADVNAQGGLYENALYAACFKGHDKIAQMLLERGADVNAQGGEYGNALQATCARGHDKITQMLLERGADVNAQGGEYGNALYPACFGGHNKIAQMLLERGADVNAQGGEYGNALQAACARGHDKITQMLLERGADVNAQGGLYENALYAACFEGHDKIAQMLLERGADGGKYRNALQAACAGGHDKITQMLLERGADVNAQGGLYENALYAACFKGHDKIAQMLLERGADVNAQGGKYRNGLQAACAGGHDKIAQMLLERGADVNAQGGKYRNALQAACAGGHDKITQMLLERGADVNAQGGLYENALYAACFKGHDKIAQMLLERGADVNAQGGDCRISLRDACSEGHYKCGRSPLSRAAQNGDQSVVKMLLDTGKVDPDSKDKDGRSPLSWAAQNGDGTVVKMILAMGKMDPDSKDEDGRSPISRAAQNGDQSVVKMLLDTGKVDPDSKDKDGRSPLSWAAQNGDQSVVKMLLDTGKVDPDSKDKDGRSPLSWAAQNDDGAVIKMILATGKVNVDWKDNHGRTPLSRAAENINVAPFKMLLATDNVYTDSKDKNNRTPLFLAAKNGRKDVVKLLLDTGNIHVDSKDSCNWTPLSWAARNGHEAVVRLLLATCNVHVDSGDNYNWTPLSWAAQNGHETVVNMLLDTGNVSIDSKDIYGRTPLSWARKNGHKMLAYTLIGMGSVEP